MLSRMSVMEDMEPQGNWSLAAAHCCQLAEGSAARADGTWKMEPSFSPAGGRALTGVRCIDGLAGTGHIID